MAGVSSGYAGWGVGVDRRWSAVRSVGTKGGLTDVGVAPLPPSWMAPRWSRSQPGATDDQVSGPTRYRQPAGATRCGVGGHAAKDVRRAISHSIRGRPVIMFGDVLFESHGESGPRCLSPRAQPSQTSQERPVRVGVVHQTAMQCSGTAQGLLTSAIPPSITMGYQEEEPTPDGSHEINGTLDDQHSPDGPGSRASCLAASSDVTRRPPSYVGNELPLPSDSE